MDSSPENFEGVQRLLRLKRYEQPPPRYFRNFSNRVIARIERGESRRASGWWERFGFDLRPAIAAAAGMTGCALIFLGIGSAVDGDARAVAENSPAGASLLAPQFVNAIEPQEAAAANSTNPVFAPQISPLPGRIGSQIVPVSYRP